MLVLGDSLARGTGDEEGRGFAQRLVPLLRPGGPVELANLGVDGATSEDVRQLSESANVATLARSADVIVVSMGGNDLSRSVPRGSGAPVQIVEEIGRTRDRFAENLRFVLKRLREANPTAPIFLVGLYNPFSADRRSSLPSAVIARWNGLMQETALSFPGVFLVPTFDFFQGGAENLVRGPVPPQRTRLRNDRRADRAGAPPLLPRAPVKGERLKRRPADSQAVKIGAGMIFRSLLGTKNRPESRGGLAGKEEDPAFPWDVCRWSVAPAAVAAARVLAALSVVPRVPPVAIVVVPVVAVVVIPVVPAVGVPSRHGTADRNTGRSRNDGHCRRSRSAARTISHRVWWRRTGTQCAWRVR